MGFLDRIFGAPRTQTLVEVEGPGLFDVEIVGEASYQRVLAQITGGHSRDGHDLIVDAILFLEDSNPYDSQAVQVAIESSICGYLSRANARIYRSDLIAVGLPDAIVRCKAKIVGGWDRGDGDRGHFGVKLDLPKLGA